MEILIAQILGPIAVILAITAMVNQKNFKKILEDSVHTSNYYYASVSRVLIGIIIVNSDNEWNNGLQITIAILGWLILISGAAGLFFPKEMIKITKPFIKNEKLVHISLITLLILGIALLYIGYGG